MLPHAICRRLCDHLVLMTGGHIRLAGAIDDLLTRHQPEGATVVERFENLVLAHLADVEPPVSRSP